MGTESWQHARVPAAAVVLTRWRRRSSTVPPESPPGWSASRCCPHTCWPGWAWWRPASCWTRCRSVTPAQTIRSPHYSRTGTRLSAPKKHIQRQKCGNLTEWCHCINLSVFGNWCDEKKFVFSLTRKELITTGIWSDKHSTWKQDCSSPTM